MDTLALAAHHFGMTRAGAAQVWSTSAVAPGQAFEYWRDLICDTFVQLTASPVGERGFGGKISHREFPGFEMSVVTAGGQRVRRTASLIARSGEAYLLASIQTAGHGRIDQDGRTAELTPGSMAYYDSTRPYTLHFDDRFEQIVVQVPRDLALSVAGMRAPIGATARALGRHGAAGVVAEFFRSLALAQQDDPAGAERLSGPAVELFASAFGLAGGHPPSDAATVLQREQIVTFLRRSLSAQHLDVEVIAEHFHVSRRTVFRQFAGEPDGVMGLLRRMRIERAQQLLLRDATRTVGEIAAACGFAGAAQFHRTFRQLTGTTPGALRAEWRNGTNRHSGGTHRRFH